MALSEASQGPCWKSNSVSATEALDGLPPFADTPMSARLLSSVGPSSSFSVSFPKQS